MITWPQTSHQLMCKCVKVFQWHFCYILYMDPCEKSHQQYFVLLMSLFQVKPFPSSVLLPYLGFAQSLRLWKQSKRLSSVHKFSWEPPPQSTSLGSPGDVLLARCLSFPPGEDGVGARPPGEQKSFWLLEFATGVGKFHWVSGWTIKTLRYWTALLRENQEEMIIPLALLSATLPPFLDEVLLSRLVKIVSSGLELLTSMIHST